MRPDRQATGQAESHHPAFGTAITLGCYQLALAAYERTRLPLLQPVLVGMLLLMGILLLSGLDFEEYLQMTSSFTVLLGPVIVALAVPLYLNLRHIRRLIKPVMQTLLIAGLLATLLGSGLAWLFGASEDMLRTLLTKSVTSPFSILLASEVGGIPALAAIFSIITGIIGAILGPDLLRIAGVTHPAARGMAFGLTSHAVGTATAIREGEQCGAFSALAMSLIGLFTAVLLPIAVAILS